MNRYVYRADVEPPARPVTDGSQNVIALGAAHVSRLGIPPAMTEATECIGCNQPNIPGTGQLIPVLAWRNPGVISMPAMPSAPVAVGPGATAIVSQPPPPSAPPGSTVVSNPGLLPLSPSPSPTVAVSPTQTAPSLTIPGTTLDSTGASTTTTAAPTDIVAQLETWLGEQSTVLGYTVPNYALALLGAGLAYWLLGSGGKRGRR